MELVSPKFQMELIQKVETAIWDKYKSTERVKYYIQKWKDNVKSTILDFTVDGGFWGSSIELLPTLGNMKFDLLVRIAIELDINVPGYIPSIPTFQYTLQSEYSSAFDSFQKALKQVEEEPSLAIGLANSTLESIIKEIIQSEIITIKYDKKKTLYALTQDILKEFSLFPNNEMPEEIRNIGSSLIQICISIENLRSNKTHFHGKVAEDYIVTDKLYAYFVINSVTTVGLFLKGYYEKKYK